MRAEREKPGQNATNKWAEARGIDHTTMLLRGKRGEVDEIYWIPGGRPVLIEFKAYGKRPRKLQEHIHKRRRENGYIVEVHDNAEDAIESLARHIAALPKVRKAKTAGRLLEAQYGEERLLLVPPLFERCRSSRKR